MADIVVSTSNARYGHASLALRYLVANLGDLRPRAVLQEFVLQDRPADIVERLLAERPRVVGLGVYVWNARQMLEVVRILTGVRPDVDVVLGGPEISHEIEDQELAQRADFVICGEGDLAFRDLCRQLLVGRRPSDKVIRPPLPELREVASPYELYSDDDLAKRAVYVEATRGCPFGCEFCLSALDRRVRRCDLDVFLADLNRLIERGARHIKFVDRTFNLEEEWAANILGFLAERRGDGLFAHFEMVADRLPAAVRDALLAFGPGEVQLEVGVQSFDPETLARIGRRQDLRAVEENLRYLRAHTQVHLHTDLIVGLPGEPLQSIAAGFDRLVGLGPQEIQVGILKRLRGALIARHAGEWAMTFSEAPPYELLQSATLSFEELQRLKRFARAWDLVANSGNFRGSAPLIWGDESPFFGFLAFADWLHDRLGSFSGIGLPRLTAALLEYLVSIRGIDRGVAAEGLAADYARPGRRLPGFLADLAPAAAARGKRPPESAPRRQGRHLT